MERLRRQIDALADSHHILTAPAQMGMGSALTEVCSYLEAIRTAVLAGDKKVFIDLSQCEFIAPVPCLLLAAEVSRCNALRPGMVWGTDPSATSACQTLDAFGFYDEIGFARPRPGPRHNNVHRIQSAVGIREGNPGSRTRLVADICTDFAFRDQKFANQVHAALNEATENSITWGYTPLVTPTMPAQQGRWWVAGMFDPDAQAAIFMALDHGVGIPATAPVSPDLVGLQAIREMLDAGAAGIPGERDHLILQETIRARKTLSGASQRGKGLNAMLGLIDSIGAGRVNIFSGRGAYVYGLNPGTEVTEQALPLDYEFPGTLIIWQVLASSDQDAEHGDD